MPAEFSVSPNFISIFFGIHDLTKKQAGCHFSLYCLFLPGCDFSGSLPSGSIFVRNDLFWKK
jgi:hypothetical protein